MPDYVRSNREEFLHSSDTTQDFFCQSDAKKNIPYELASAIKSPCSANLKPFANAWGIDIAKLKEVDKRFLVCKIWVLAKQKQNLSYKAQSQPDICEILHINLMRPKTPIVCNGYRYEFPVINKYFRCRWVENLHEKCDAGLALKRFVILIENQAGKTVKRIFFDQEHEFGVRDLEFRTKEKGIKVKYTVAYSPKMNKIAE